MALSRIILFAMFIGVFSQFSYAQTKGQDDNYKVEVYEIKKLHEYVDGHGSVKPSDIGNVLLTVELRIYKNGKRFDAKNELSDVSIVDDKNRIHHLSKTTSGEINYRGVLKGEMPNVFFDPVLFFAIPEDSKGLKIKYRNAPIVELNADKIAVSK
jgi:hypothetical protein